MSEFGDLLIVDDEEMMGVVLSGVFEDAGFTVRTATNGEEAIRHIGERLPDVLLLDIIMPGLSGMDVLRRIKSVDEGIPVILMTAMAGVSGAVEAMRAGAFDYIAKPFHNDELLRIVTDAAKQRRTRNEQRMPVLTDEEEQQGQRDPILFDMGTSAVIMELAARTRRVAKSNFDVLVTGETGTGKELIARAIHSMSSRADKPFIPIDTGAIPEALLESELFGHEEGAFTDARNQKKGKFEMAQGGTIFLDEVPNMSWQSQAKLLRALQDRAIFRVGGTKSISIDVRVIAASNTDFQAMIDEKRFRADLFYRLREFSIHVPALRERRADIPFLVDKFIRQTNGELGKNITGCSAAAMDALMMYDWPGNVRQLRSTVRGAVLQASHLIEIDHLEFIDMVGGSSTAGFGGEALELESGVPLKEHVKKHIAQIERQIIYETLKSTKWNKAKTARVLQIAYNTLLTKIAEYDLQNPNG
ncbi:MAG: sigma-54 dependent transcriptional regulator [Bacteroidota bacterium]|jgi:two-component system nitrogen regulation response regulator GlnG|nr:sigma-54 dependent transcriptional regulator [Bacteroidota bacterium]